MNGRIPQGSGSDQEGRTTPLMATTVGNLYAGRTEDPKAMLTETMLRAGIKGRKPKF